MGLSLGILLIAAIGAVRDPIPWWVPQRACQVSARRLVSHHITRVSLRWGFDLGIGVRTFVVTPAFYGIIALAIVAPSPVFSLALGELYGLARVVTIATFSRVVRRRLVAGCDRTEPALGLARRLRWAVGLATLLMIAFVGWSVTETVSP